MTPRLANPVRELHLVEPTIAAPVDTNRQSGMRLLSRLSPRRFRLSLKLYFSFPIAPRLHDPAWYRSLNKSLRPKLPLNPAAAHRSTSQDEAEAASLWQARRIVLWIMMALERHPHEKSINADTDVPMGFGSNTRHLKVLMSFS